jgi:SlyX protein
MANDTDTQARIAELETQLAFQDDLLQSLNKVVIRQEEQLGQLALEVKSLREQVSSIAAEPARPNSEEPPPPHY